MKVLWTLVRRTLGRAAGILASVATLFALFQIALVAIAAALNDAGGFSQLASLAPAFIVQLMGPALTTFAGMTSLSFFEPLIVMVLVLLAIYLAAEPAGDVESELVDLLLARPLGRHVIVTRTLIVMTAAVLVLPAAMGLSLWAGLHTLAPPGVVWPRTSTVILLMAHLTAVSWCFGGAALAAGAWARRRGQAQSVVGVAAVALYLMEFVGEAWPRQIWLARVSPFHHFHGPSLLAGQTDPVRDLAILITVGAIGAGLAYWQFQRRDV